MSSFASTADARTLDFGGLGALMSGMRGGFAENGPVHFSPAPDPQHFRPANPGTNPTAGWDPFDPLGEKAKAPPAPEMHDPIDAARAEGFAAGMEMAEKMAAERGEIDAQALARIATGLEAMSAFDRDALASRLRQTVLLLVARMIGDCGVSADQLTHRIDAAIGLLADTSEAATLRLNPDDLPLMEGHVPERVAPIADPSVERGGFRIETRMTTIEDGPTAWLAQLTAALDRAALPDAA